MGCSSSNDTSETRQVTGNKKVVHNKSDLSIRKSDFVRENLKISDFKKHYKSDGVEIGAGAFGKVRKVTHRQTGEARAVKMIDKLGLSADELELVAQEVHALKNLTHPSIVRLYDVYESRSMFYLVTELAEGCELFDEIQQRDNFSEQQAAVVLQQLLQAIAYCHSQNIAHRDLKPENILIDIQNKGSIKLLDFGTSFRYDSETHEMNSLYGTPYYVAPEVLEANSGGTYSEKCDLWSIGVMMFIMLSGKPPFFAASEEAILAKVQLGEWSFKSQIWKEISPEAKDLVSKLLEIDVEKRLSAIEALAHGWIKNKVKTSFSFSLGKAALKNLGNFQNNSKMIQATMTFLTSHLVTKQQNAELKKTFAQFDENGDGLIEESEFVSAYVKLYPKQDPQDVAERAVEVFSKADTDNSGSIDFTEWCTATIDQTMAMNESNMRAAFKLFDNDNSGRIDASEVATVLGKNAAADESVWQEVIKEIDVNGDGQVDFEEFQQMIVTLANKRDTHDQCPDRINSINQQPLDDAADE